MKGFMCVVDGDSLRVWLLFLRLLLMLFCCVWLTLVLSLLWPWQRLFFIAVAVFADFAAAVSDD